MRQKIPARTWLNSRQWRRKQDFSTGTRGRRRPGGQAISAIFLAGYPACQPQGNREGPAASPRLSAGDLGGIVPGPSGNGAAQPHAPAQGPPGLRTSGGHSPPPPQEGLDGKAVYENRPKKNPRHAGIKIKTGGGEKRYCCPMTSRNTRGSEPVFLSAWESPFRAMVISPAFTGVSLPAVSVNTPSPEIMI